MIIKFATTNERRMNMKKEKKKNAFEKKNCIAMK